MLTGQDIIFISSIEWNFVWQGHQEISLRLARAGNRVLYIENTGIRAPGLGDMSRIGARLKRWAKTLRTGGVRQVAPDVWVCSPLVMPPFSAVWHRWLNRKIFLPLINRVVRKLGFRRPLVWTYLPSDTALDLILMLRTPESVTAYYCGGDFLELVPERERVRVTELQVANVCDVVFTNCEALTRRFDGSAALVRQVTFGVDLTAFPFDGGNAPVPEELAGLTGPVIGYVGGLHRHVDIGLLREMALARSDWSWVFVGPEQTSLATISGLPNVHLVGQKPHGELAQYLGRFDVCLIPYLNNAYTATVVPVKLNEYLAMGKPVVSTDLPVVSDFNAEHHVATVVPGRVREFLVAIEIALADGEDPSARAHRRRIAELSDWKIRLDEICGALELADKNKNER
ncbi:MAG: glycosyltransferase [Pyrinomonadaceae bacterium]